MPKIELLFSLPQINGLSELIPVAVKITNNEGNPIQPHLSVSSKANSHIRLSLAKDITPVSSSIDEEYLGSIEKSQEFTLYLICDSQQSVETKLNVTVKIQNFSITCS